MVKIVFGIMLLIIVAIILVFCKINFFKKK